LQSLLTPFRRPICRGTSPIRKHLRSGTLRMCVYIHIYIYIYIYIYLYIYIYIY